MPEPTALLRTYRIYNYIIFKVRKTAASANGLFFDTRFGINVISLFRHRNSAFKPDSPAAVNVLGRRVVSKTEIRVL
jgi:hypothetical protein